jgi:hypothetical protein
MNKIFFLILLISTNLSLYGQSFYGGINIGTTLSQVDGDTYGGYHKIQPLGGVYVRNTFNDNWGASLGIFYKHKGSKEVQKDEDNYVTRFYKMNLQYIELPVMLNYKIKKIGIPRLFEYEFENDFFIEFGFSYAYLINATEDFGHGPIPPPTRQYRKYEIANHLGLVYRLNNHWLLNGRFSYTCIFLPIREHPGGQVYWFNRGEYNHNLNFSIMYEF